MTTTDPKLIPPQGSPAALAEELREYTAMKYAGDCKCGKCQLVPRALIERIYHTLNAIPAPVAGGPVPDPDNLALADEMLKLGYPEFGDCLSFDAFNRIVSALRAAPSPLPAGSAWPKEEIEPGRFVDVDPESIVTAVLKDKLRLRLIDDGDGDIISARVADENLAVRSKAIVEAILRVPAPPLSGADGRRGGK